MTTTQKRARIGGETGTNGEFYEGGKFLPSTGNAKRLGSAPKGTGKQEIEPFVWVVAPEPGLRSIFKALSGILAKYDHATKTFAFAASEQTLAWLGTTRVEAEALIAKYNAGERWMPRA